MKKPFGNLSPKLKIQVKERVVAVLNLKILEGIRVYFGVGIIALIVTHHQQKYNLFKTFSPLIIPKDKY